MITVTAVQLAKEGKEAQLEALMKDLTVKIKTNEPGNATFEYFQSKDKPRTYLVIEQYIDEEAFAYHKTTPYLKDFIPKMMECLEQPPDVETYGDVFPASSTEPHTDQKQPQPLFHIGIVVPDLEQAMARFSEVLGVKFAEPATFHIPCLEDPNPQAGQLVASFSMTGPPYYELIQAAGDGIISVANAGKILYFALWESDMAGRIEALQKQNIGLETLFRMDEKTPPFSMITKPDLMGVRIEYVEDTAREAIEEWARTGKYPGGIGG